MSLKGETAVITGGTSGIGLGTARNCLKEEASNLFLLDICENEQNVQQLKDEFPESNIVYLSTDITKRDAVDKTFENILKLVTGIDVVVNCAGVYCETDLTRTINVNLIGCIHVSLAAWNAMSKVNGGNGGSIVNISSIAGLVALPCGPYYNASKHGVIGFTRTMANDCYYTKHGVKFAIACPGVTLTPMFTAPPALQFTEGVECIEELLTKSQQQTADQCGSNVVKIATTAENGTTWILDGGKMERVAIPEYWQPTQS